MFGLFKKQVTDEQLRIENEKLKEKATYLESTLKMKDETIQYWKSEARANARRKDEVAYYMQQYQRMQIEVHNANKGLGRKQRYIINLLETIRVLKDNVKFLGTVLAALPDGGNAVMVQPLGDGTGKADSKFVGRALASVKEGELVTVHFGKLTEAQINEQTRAQEEAVADVSLADIAEPYQKPIERAAHG